MLRDLPFAPGIVEHDQRVAGPGRLEQIVEALFAAGRRRARAALAAARHPAMEPPRRWKWRSLPSAALRPRIAVWNR